MGYSGGEGVPRGPPEWGPIIYQDEWAALRQRENPGHNWMGMLVVIVGLVVMGGALYMAIFLEGRIVGSIVAPVGAVLLTGGLVVYLRYWRSMPLRIYETGVTMTKVPLSHGRELRETLVPWSDVAKAELETHQLPGRTLRRLDLVLMGPEGKQRTQSLFFFNLRDPAGLLRKLNELVPDKLDPGSLEYLRKHDTEAAAREDEHISPGRGALLSETPLDVMERNRSTNVKTAYAFIAIGVIVLAVTFLFVPGWLGDEAAICMVFPVLAAVLLLSLGVLALMLASRATPIRVYENGVEWTTLLKGTAFHPWGFFASVEETEMGEERTLTLRAERGPYWGMINSKLPGYDEWSLMVKERVGDVRYGTEIVTPEGVEHARPETAGKYRLIPLVIAAIGLGVGFVFGFMDWAGLGAIVHPGGPTYWVVVGVPTGLLFFFFILIFTMRVNFFGFAVRKVSFATVAVVVMGSILVLAGTLWASGPIEVNFGNDIYEDPEPAGTSLIPGMYNDTTITVDGPVTVSAGEVLTLVNVTLVFDPAPNIDYGIWVHADGELTMVNTTVDSVDHRLGYAFEVHGTAHISGSRIVATAANPAHQNGDGGLEVYSDRIWLVDTVFEGSNSNGVMTVECSPTIDRCTFVDVADDGIEVNGGAPRISDCTFIRVEWPIITWGSEARIEGCTFRDCPRGIVVDFSDPVIRDCTFDNITLSAIRYSEASSPQLEGNSFEDVGKEKEEVSSPSGMGFLCSTFGVIIAVVGLLVVYILNRKRPPVDTLPRDELGLGRGVI